MLRHPRRVLGALALVLVFLGVLGTGVEGRLSPTSLDIPGTPSSSANRVLQEHFGDSAPFVILLRGPAPALERQGPALVRALRDSSPAVTTLSPGIAAPSGGCARAPAAPWSSSTSTSGGSRPSTTRSRS